MNDAEIKELISLYKETGDTKYRDKVYEQFDTLVPYVLKKFPHIENKGAVDCDDLYSAGKLALLRCIKSFNVKGKGKFITYATTCVVNACIREMSKERLVPEYVSRKCKRISRIIEDHGQDVESAAQSLDTDVESIEALLARYRNGKINSIEQMPEHACDDNIEDGAINRISIMDALKDLSKEEMQVLHALAEGYAICEICDMYGISDYRITCILNAARDAIIAEGLR